jgi:small subunit ribosomal protein S17
MPKRLAIGIVTSDKMKQSRRVEIPRLVKHPKYGKYMRRKTVCHVHDEQEESHIGDTVEIVECPPKSKLKRWELVRVLSKSRLVDIAAMRVADRLVGEEQVERKGERHEKPVAPEN